MKVLHATTSIGWSGGTEQCFLFAKYMREFGVETAVLTYPGTELEKRAVESGIRVFHFPLTGKLDLKGAKELSRIISQFTVVNTYISRAHWFIWLSCLFAKKRPVVVYTRGVNYPISPISAITKYNINTDMLIAVSPAVSNRLSKFPFLRKKIRLVPPGIELQRFSRDTAGYSKKDFGIDPNGKVLVNVANFSEVKGSFVLLKAFCELSKRFENLFLFLVGRDTEKAIPLARKLGIEKKVFALGFRRDVPQILKACDVFVFPSLNEGFGSSLIQAMAMGMIVVATKVGGIPYYLKDGKNGILVEPNSVESLVCGIERALSNLENDKMKNSAVETAREFDIRKIAKKTLEIYEEAVKISFSDNSRKR